MTVQEDPTTNTQTTDVTENATLAGSAAVTPENTTATPKQPTEIELNPGLGSIITQVRAYLGCDRAKEIMKVREKAARMKADLKDILLENIDLLAQGDYSPDHLAHEGTLPLSELLRKIDEYCGNDLNKLDQLLVLAKRDRAKAARNITTKVHKCVAFTREARDFRTYSNGDPNAPITECVFRENEEKRRKMARQRGRK